jgi:hypothetical protein
MQHIDFYFITKVQWLICYIVCYHAGFGYSLIYTSVMHAEHDLASSL